MVAGKSRAGDAFWKGKSVLVTGVEGFIGSNLANSLLEKGAKVAGLIKEKLPVSNMKISGIDTKISKVYGVVENYPLIQKALREHKVEYIFHLAAQAIVGLAYESPLPTFESNIKGTWCILEAARVSKGIKGVVVASSDKAYGSHKKLPYREEFSLSPIYPYEISKACIDLIARGYYHSYRLPVVVLRAANTYGPGDINLSRIIPETVHALLEDKEPIIRSDGTPLRDFLFIDDSISAYLTAARKISRPGMQGEAFNVGTKEPVQIIDLVKSIIKISKKTKIKPKIVGKSVPIGEIDRQYLDSQKFYKATGWKYKTPLDQGLQKTWGWWVRNWDSLKDIPQQ